VKGKLECTWQKDVTGASKHPLILIDLTSVTS